MSHKNNSSGSVSAILDQQKYVKIDNFIEPPLLDILYRYILIRSQNGQLSVSDEQVPGAPSMYADPLMEALMDVVLRRIEELSGSKLFPTYSYYRLYRQGDTLHPHIDRPSCEISFSICLGYDISNQGDGEHRWPIYIDNSRDYRRDPKSANAPARPDEGHAVLLSPGDCVIYKGCEARHWRLPFEGVQQAQAFIHYVAQDGPYAKYKYDTRPQLGAGAETITHKGPHRYFPISFKKKA